MNLAKFKIKPPTTVCTTPNNGAKVVAIEVPSEINEPLNANKTPFPAATDLKPTPAANAKPLNGAVRSTPSILNGEIKAVKTAAATPFMAPNAIPIEAILLANNEASVAPPANLAPIGTKNAANFPKIVKAAPKVNMAPVSATKPIEILRIVLTASLGVFSVRFFM